MKGLAVTLLGSLLLSSSPVWSAPILGGMKIFTTGAGLACGPGGSASQEESTTTSQTWTTNAAIKIAKIQIWNGLDYGTIADVPEIVTRVSDGAILIDGGHDDYVNGGSVRVQSQDWGGNYFPLNAGDSLQFTYGCPHGTLGSWVVTIWTR